MQVHKAVNDSCYCRGPLTPQSHLEHESTLLPSKMTADSGEVKVSQPGDPKQIRGDVVKLFVNRARG